jgi:hypothetical protein
MIAQPRQSIKDVHFPPIADSEGNGHTSCMAVPPEFWLTSGKARYRAILERYELREITSQMACEYLAELSTSDAEFDEQQQHRILGAYALVHDLSDGIAVDSCEFEAILPAR